MNYEVALLRLVHRSGIQDQTLAQEGLHQVLRYLGGCFEEETLRELSTHLPPPLGESMTEGKGGNRPCELDQLYRAVSDEMGLEVSLAMEFTQVVLQIFGECFRKETRQKVQSLLPRDWAPLLEPREQARSSPLGRRGALSLAEGRAGSSRPISEARPGHRNSIAFSEDPEKGRKVSTTSGKPAERTLASGKPGSSRSLSDP